MVQLKDTLPVLAGIAVGATWTYLVNDGLTVIPSDNQQVLTPAVYAMGACVGLNSIMQYRGWQRTRQLGIEMQKTDLSTRLKESAAVACAALVTFLGTALTAKAIEKGIELRYDATMTQLGYGVLDPEQARTKISQLEEIENNTLSIITATALVGYTFTSSFISSLRGGITSKVEDAQLMYAKISGNKELQEKLLVQSNAKKEPHRTIEACLYFADQKRYGLAMKKAGELFEEGIVIRQDQRHKAFSAVLPNQQRNVDDALYALLVGDAQKALELMQKGDRSLTNDMLCSKIARLQEDEEQERRFLVRAAQRVIKNPGIKLEQRTESANEVLFIQDPHFDEFFVYKQIEQEQITQQREYQQEAEDILFEEPIIFPRYLSTVSIKGETYGVWEFEKGRTLYDLQKEKSNDAQEYTARSARVLGKLLGALSAEQTQSDITQKIYDRVLAIAKSLHPDSKRRFKIDDKSIASQVAENIDPLQLAHQSSPNVRRKDYHPENIIITQQDQKLALIDWDVSPNPVTLHAEAANLLAYVPGFTQDQIGHFLEQIEQGYQQSNGDLEKGQLHQTFPMGVIQRSIALAGAWSHINRQSLWDQRQLLLENAARQANGQKRKQSKYEKQLGYLEDALTRLAHACLIDDN